MQQKEIFERIFSDAHVVDIDLSEWDKRIALYVIAGHMQYTASGRSPLFIVEFSHVRSWNIVFNHLSHDPPINLEPDKHVQWIIYDFRVQLHEEGGWQITLWGHSASPRMTLVCQEVTFREMSHATPDRLFPGWGKPWSGLIRPGLAALERD